MNNALEIKNITKKIGKRTILEDVSLEVKEGEIFGFVGPNGAGKTTLIKVMLGLYKQDAGSISICGFDIRDNFEKATDEIGAIIENPEMYGYLSGKDNLKIYANMETDVDKEYINEIIKMVKLEERIKHKVKTYSLGMRQRLGVAQALLSNPKLLVLDEPTNGLDPLGIKELRDMLQDLAKEKNMAVFISSHILSEIQLMCDRIAIIDNGKIIEIKDMTEINEDNTLNVTVEVKDIKPVKELLKETNMNPTYAGNYFTVFLEKEQLPEFNKYLIKSGIDIYEIRIEKKNLEDEFIEKTKGTKGQIK